MKEQELKTLVYGFIQHLSSLQETHHNFDFFMFFDIDSPKPDSEETDVMYVNTFKDEFAYNSGLVMIDTLMHERRVRGMMSDGEHIDVLNNSNLRIRGFGGYIIN